MFVGRGGHGIPTEGIARGSSFVGTAVVEDAELSLDYSHQPEAFIGMAASIAIIW